MLTPTSNVVRLFYNEKCKGCENAVWIAVPRFYYATPDGMKYIENKAAICKKYLEKERQACFDRNARFAEDYFIDSRDYLLYRHYDCEDRNGK